MKTIVGDVTLLLLSDDKIKALELLGHIYFCDDCKAYHVSPHSSWANVEAIVYYNVFK